jgi:hypothetical protein
VRIEVAVVQARARSHCKHLAAVNLRPGLRQRSASIKGRACGAHRIILARYSTSAALEDMPSASDR